MKNEKNVLGVFIFQKYDKFWSILLELFVKHKPLISEEWAVFTWQGKIHLKIKFLSFSFSLPIAEMFFGLAEVKSYAKNCCCAGCGTPLPLSQNVQPIRLILAQCEYPSFYRQVMEYPKLGFRMPKISIWFKETIFCIMLLLKSDLYKKALAFLNFIWL